MIPDPEQVGNHTPTSFQVDQSVPAVMLDHVSKWYGQVIGLNDVSLAIGGVVTVFLGPNGAG